MIRLFATLPTLLLLAAGAHAAGPEHIRSGGRDYVRLDDWARGRDFQVRWVDADHTFQLSNRFAHLAFSTDPHQDGRRIEINGVNVWLAFPILSQNGHAYVSESDVSDTLNPILSPPQNPPGVRIKSICLDPGHGGKDPGFVVGRSQEKKLTLLLAREVQDQLTKAGFNVFLTRNSDTYVDLAERPAIAHRRNADLFVSLHFNAVEDGRDEVKGVQVYSCTPPGATSSNAGGEGDTRPVTGNRSATRSMLLAYDMQRAFLDNLPIEDRGVKRARYAVLRDATMPGILIEGGFLSHPVEGKKIADPGYRRQMAKAIVDGILAYKRTVRG